jgi:hypothetical protein
MKPWIVTEDLGSGHTRHKIMDGHHAAEVHIKPSGAYSISGDTSVIETMMRDNNGGMQLDSICRQLGKDIFFDLRPDFYLDYFVNNPHPLLKPRENKHDTQKIYPKIRNRNITGLCAFLGEVLAIAAVLYIVLFTPYRYDRALLLPIMAAWLFGWLPGLLIGLIIEDLFK